MLGVEERIKLINDLLNRRVMLVGGTVRDILTTRPCEVEDVIAKLGGTVKLLGKGNYGRAVALCTDADCTESLVLKVTKITGDNNPDENENSEVAVLQLLQSLILSGQTPSLPLIVADFVCQRTAYAEEDEDLVEIKINERYIVLERALYDLQTYCKRIEDSGITMPGTTWQVILFQLVWTLAVVQEHYPTFRHNDLSPGNIFLLPGPTTGYTSYTWGDLTYYLPNVGFNILISDFGMATVAGKIYNLNAAGLIQRNIGIDIAPNRYVDMVKMLYWLWYNGNFNALLAKDDLLRPLIKKFVTNNLPIGIQSTIWYQNNSSIIDYEYATPRDMLNSPLFNDLKIPQTAISTRYTFNPVITLGARFAEIATATITPKCDEFHNIYLMPKKMGLVRYDRDSCPDKLTTTPAYDTEELEGELNDLIPNYPLKTQIIPIAVQLFERLNKYMELSVGLSNLLRLVYDIAGHAITGLHWIKRIQGFRDMRTQLYHVIYNTDLAGWLSTLRLPLATIIREILPSWIPTLKS